jgi:hypothetical protein
MIRELLVGAMLVIALQKPRVLAICLVGGLA